MLPALPRPLAVLGVLVVLLIAPCRASSPIALAPDGHTVWVVNPDSGLPGNPDSGTIAKLDAQTSTRLGEYAVGRYPRTIAVTAAHVYVTNQGSDSVTRLDPDGTNALTTSLGFGCAPYGVATSPDGNAVYVTCQGPSTLVVLDGALAVQRVVRLAWPEARALAVAPDATVYVTHFITKEPNRAGHVSEVDAAAGTVKRVLTIAPDFATCETLGSGQGVANLLSAVALVPAGAPAAVAGQLWVGGTLHNSLRKGLFERSAFFKDKPGIGLFPDLDFQSSPAGSSDAAHRNVYKAARHDIARAGIWKIDLASGNLAGRIDVAGGGQIADLAFAPAGDVAYAVDAIANGAYVLNPARGQGANPAAVFGPVSAAGPGGADPGAACSGAADAMTAEAPFILPPQARLVPTHGMEPLDAVTLQPVATGIEFTLATGQMRPVGDGVGTTPTGIVPSADGTRVYVANYLARNVAVLDGPASGFRCLGAPATPCTSALDCPGHADCMPLVRAVVSTTDHDTLTPEVLDGKILFSTAARDAGGAGAPVPPWNVLAHDGSMHQGDVTSTARDGESLACTTCHGDFGGNDGRTWDFSQFSSSLRNTMDLRGRASLTPGTCSQDASIQCTTDSACGPDGTGVHCRNDPRFVPPNILPADRLNFFNPMASTHWNGDRDEVEDFEFTYRELLGASDCDGAEEKPETCVGALVVRRFVADPTDARADLGQPNRNRSPRLNHMADFVYSLREFPRNPNVTAVDADAAERGRLIFNDQSVNCIFCHNSSLTDAQQFTNKQPNHGFDPNQTPRADLNSPFLRFNVGTANVFDGTNPFVIANDEPKLLGFTLFQNEQIPIPGNRAVLTSYITPGLTDAWNTAPYLHDGSAPTLLSVVLPCNTDLDDCARPGKGRNVNEQHGQTSFLSARQLNDLVAFELAPHGPILEAPGVRGVVMNQVKLVARFGRKRGRDALVFKGSARLPTQQVEPGSDPVVVSIGVPAGERMAVVERAIPPDHLKTNGARTSFQYADPHGTRLGGLRRLVLRVKGNVVRFQVALARADLSVLRVSNPVYTLGIEIGGQTLAATRSYKTNHKGTVTKGPTVPKVPRGS